MLFEGGLIFVPNLLLQRLSDIFNRSNGTGAEVRQPQTQETCYSSAAATSIARGEWFSAIGALEDLLLNIIDTTKSEEQRYQGLILSGPAPILSNISLISRFERGTFTPEAFKSLALMPCKRSGSPQVKAEEIASSIAELPLLPKDPIAEEWFCLAFTSTFSLLMVLGEDSTGKLAFQFSFEPETIQQAWNTLRGRLLLVNHHQLDRLDALVEQFTPVEPNYRIVMNFSGQLLKNLPDLLATEARKTRSVEAVSCAIANEKNNQVLKLSEQKKTAPREVDFSEPHLPLVDGAIREPPEAQLLQALTHEVRTPLTTIRTLTRLLLKRRRHLTPEIIKRLELIDRECTEQINRMELIFRAAELETKSAPTKQVELIPISLEQVFHQSIPCWQKQAKRRNVVLDFILPKKLPQVISDPEMLDRILTGLMENMTRSLPNGGKIQVRVTTAGNQLKLQLLSEQVRKTYPFKSIGHLLMFEPETGSLSLNMEVTKNIFHTLGGKLIIRNSPKHGEVLTIFLPLGTPNSDIRSLEHSWK